MITSHQSGQWTNSRMKGAIPNEDPKKNYNNPRNIHCFKGELHNHSESNCIETPHQKSSWTRRALEKSHRNHRENVRQSEWKTHRATPQEARIGGHEREKMYRRMKAECETLARSLEQHPSMHAIGIEKKRNRVATGERRRRGAEPVLQNGEWTTGDRLWSPGAEGSGNRERERGLPRLSFTYSIRTFVPSVYVPYNFICAREIRSCGDLRWRTSSKGLQGRGRGAKKIIPYLVYDCI